MGVKPRVGVIGAGAGGIAMGIQLAEGGYDFTIFDRADGFGGTWRHNTFPGAACDVPSHLYSYSFALNPRWSKTYANQPEILAYLEKVADEHGLGPHLRPHTAISTVRWSDARRRWTLITDDGDEHEFDAVVSAVGMLDVPHIPDIPGAQRFRGRQFHSARWDHSKSTAGERVASIGTGRQRDPIRSRNRTKDRAVHRLSADPDLDFAPVRLPVHPRAARRIRAQPGGGAEAARRGLRRLRDSQFRRRRRADPRSDRTRPQLPDAQGGRPRIAGQADAGLSGRLQAATDVTGLVSHLCAAQRQAGNLRHHRADRTWSADRRRGRHRVDTIIYGTGFKAADYLDSIDVYGTGGRHLRDDWSDGAQAYLGTLVAGYPNFFMLYGPNTNGVNSIIYIHEAQTTFIRHILDVVGERGAHTVAVTPDAQRRYNDEIQADMVGKVWLACTNYFRHPSGRVVTQLPYSGRKFFERTRAMVDDDYSWGS